MPANLRDIADSAGVSISTVSRVLRGNTNFAAETAEKVRRVAQELGYRPNLLVRGIQTGQTQTVGVMVPTFSEFLGRLVFGIHERLATRGWTPILLWGQEGLCELEQIHRLVDRRVDGVILFPNEDTVPDSYLSEVWERKLPLVTVDRKMLRTHADFAGTDDQLGGKLAAEHLLGLGHRRLAHLSASPSISSSRERWEGFCQAVDKVPGAQTLHCVTDSFHHGLPAAEELLRSDFRPTAIFASNDYLAAAALQAARNLELRVPEALSVVGFADLSVASMVTPALTTLHQDAEDIGRTAAQMVLDRIQGQQTSVTPQRVALAPTLIVRDSTAAPPVRA